MKQLSFKQKLRNWEVLAPLAAEDIFILGIEKENMRTTLDGTLATSTHPANLGAALTNPAITTDFAEALLELVSPTWTRIDEFMAWLWDLHSFVATSLGDELIWPASMPPVLPDPDNFAIATYGTSHPGRMRHIYRRGLSLRYGRRMQAIAGIHLNLSFSAKFLELYKQLNESADCQNTIYFRILRSYLRHSWLINYLFGSSPALDASFVAGEQLPDFLEPLHQRTYYNPLSTCLRMGSMGYNNRKQSRLSVCFNNLEDYLSTMRRLKNTEYATYKAIGLRDANGERQQLSTTVLQIENEFYSSIRPKAVRSSGKQTMDALAARGTEYLEIRNLDLDPFLPCGIDADRLRFMQLFVLYLALLDSPEVDHRECQYLRALEEQINTYGLDESRDYQKLDGTSFNLVERAREILEELEPVAQLLDKAAVGTDYLRVLKQQQQNLISQQLPAVQQLSLLQDRDFVPQMLALAAQHQQKFMEHSSKRQAQLAKFQQQAQESLVAAAELEQQHGRNSATNLDEYIDDYLKGAEA